MEKKNLKLMARRAGLDAGLSGASLGYLQSFLDELIKPFPGLDVAFYKGFGEGRAMLPLAESDQEDVMFFEDDWETCPVGAFDHPPF